MMSSSPRSRSTIGAWPFSRDGTLDKNLRSEADRPRAQLAGRRRQRQDARAHGHADRRRAGRQAQARVHAARRHWRLRGGRQRGEDPRDGEQAQRQALLPPLRLPRRPSLAHVCGDAGAPPGGDHQAGRQRHDAAQPPRAKAADEAEDLRWARAPARRPEPATFGSSGGGRPTVHIRARSRRLRGGDQMMADEDTPQTPADAETPAQETPQHAVPSEQASEIAGSVEDAALEAAQEAIEAGGETPPEPATAEPGGEGHAVPSKDALEIAGVAEDAPLEALQEAEDKVAMEAAVDEEAEDSSDAEPEATPSAKPSVPGAHLEVDIVPEGADPLGREQPGYEDPYAVEGEEGEPATAASIATLSSASCSASNGASS